MFNLADKVAVVTCSSRNAAACKTVVRTMKQNGLEAGAPLRHIGVPDDIGGLALLLASPLACFITGQVIVAAGGVAVTNLMC